MKTNTYNDPYSNKARIDLLAFITPFLAENKKVLIFANKPDREKIQILFLDYHRVVSKNLLLLPIPKSIIGANNAGRGISVGGAIIFDNGNEGLIDTLIKTIRGGKGVEVLLVKTIPVEAYNEEKV